ncbi:MAG: proline iminopeptidase-family hydrolase [Pseudomonadota bacterium]
MAPLTPRPKISCNFFPRPPGVIGYVLILMLYVPCASAETTLRSGFVEVPGGPVWYEIAGGAGGIPLVALHGGPGGTSCGLQLLYPLADERPVLRYDQLGTGRSGRPRDASLWQRDRFVEALHRLRSDLGLERMHLLGHSWGGALAAYYVLEKGGKGIVSLILSSPLISTPLWIRDANALRATLPPEVQAALTRHETAGTTDDPEYLEATEVFYERFVRRGEAMEESSCDDAPRNSAIYLQMWGPTEFYATGSLQDFDLVPRLSEIDVPTLFITGEFDEARPGTIRGFAELVPGGRFEMVPGVGHASLSRSPVLYREILREFLRTVEDGAKP